MVTSKMDNLKLKGDLKINDWEKASLLHPSLIRLCKIATIESEIALKKTVD